MPSKFELLKIRRVVEMNNKQVRVELRGGSEEATLLWFSRASCREIKKKSLRVETAVLARARAQAITRPTVSYMEHLLSQGEEG